MSRVDGETFSYLLSQAGQELLEIVSSTYDGTNAFAVATQLRPAHRPEHISAGLTMVSLRRRATTKFGATAARLYFTPEGLEQATHPPVARHRAERAAAHGRESVLDLTCGVGADLIAFATAGIAVTGLDRDPVLAAVAAANLAELGLPGRVRNGDAIRRNREGYHLVFLDPARRNAAGRVFDPRSYSPPWSLVLEVLAGPACVKVAPGIPHQLIPAAVEAEWVSVNGQLKEAALWSAPVARVRRVATVMATDGAAAWSLSSTDEAGPRPEEVRSAEVRPVGRYIFEPDDAVIRAHLVADVASELEGWLIEPHLAYLSADSFASTPFARAYEVLETLPFREKQLRAALRSRDIGPITIKKRGISIAPETLRNRLDLRGSQPATLTITRTPGSALALLVKPMGRAPTRESS